MFDSIYATMESHVWKVYENIIILLGCYRLDVCHESVWPPKVAVHDSATDSSAEQQPRKRARLRSPPGLRGRSRRP